MSVPEKQPSAPLARRNHPVKDLTPCQSAFSRYCELEESPCPTVDLREELRTVL